MRVHMSDNRFPKVSVMIPTFNQERLIARSIESALRQDYPNFEVIVSDDCSSDSTYDVVKNYLGDNRLVYFRNEANLGRVANYRKTLYERVRGVWALNLDGDDYLYANDVVSHMITEILRRDESKLVAVVGSYVPVFKENGPASALFESGETRVSTGLALFLNWDRQSFGHLATLYRAEVAKSIDYYRSNTISADWESVLRLLLHGDVIVSRKIIGVWNIHERNATMIKTVADGISDFSYIEDTYRYASKQGIDSRVLELWFKRMIRFHTGSLWVSNGRLSNKLRYLLPYVLRTYPFAVTALLSPKINAKMVLARYPALFFRMRAAYHRTGAR